MDPAAPSDLAPWSALFSGVRRRGRARAHYRRREEGAPGRSGARCAQSEKGKRPPKCGPEKWNGVDGSRPVWCGSLGPPTPRPPYPHAVKENRARVRAPEGRESRQSRPYTYASSPEPPGARTELRLYRCAPELVRSLLVPAVLRCPLLLSRRLAPCRRWCSMLRRRSRFIQSLGRV